MYEENDITYKIGVNWKDVIIKIVLLLLFILLLVLIFPTPKLDTFYDGVFNDNIQTMKDAAKSYYTIDKLPVSIGESRTMTLEEMISNHMLIEFVDKDNKVCDGKDSYVQVTKTGDNEYVLKVQLSCSGQTDYILETIGCYDVCTDGNCQTVTDTDSNALAMQYQFKKEVSSNVTTYTCPSGYTKKGAKCYKNSGSTTINATATYFSDSTSIVPAKMNTSGSYTVSVDPLTKKGNVSCPSGYTSNGTQCVKVYNASISTTSGAYTCPSGYTLSGTQCYKTYAATYSGGSTSYTCPSGYTRSGSTCYKSYQASYKSGASNYTCPYGGALNGTQCVYKASYKAGAVNYTCPKGDLSGSNCVYAATPSTTYGNWYVVTTYRDNNKTRVTYANTTEKLEYNGFKYEHTCSVIANCPTMVMFHYYTLYRRKTTTTYSCPTGNLYGTNKCIYPATKTVGAGQYYCPTKGNVDSNHNCVYAAVQSGTSGGYYYCPNGGNPNGSTCVISIPATKNTGAGSYTCPNGGYVNGTLCRIDTKATKGNGSSVLSCPYGGTLSGSKCTTYTEGTATTTYYCPDGYTQGGSGASTTCKKTIHNQSSYYCENGNATLKGDKCYVKVKGGISGYVCPSGYTKNGTKCIKTSTETIDATASITATKSYQYTWSNSSTLEGWIATGKTRMMGASGEVGDIK